MPHVRGEKDGMATSAGGPVDPNDYPPHAFVGTAREAIVIFKQETPNCLGVSY